MMQAKKHSIIYNIQIKVINHNIIILLINNN